MIYNERLYFYLGANKDTPHQMMNEYSIDNLTCGVNPHDNTYDKPLKILLTKTNNKN